MRKETSNQFTEGLVSDLNPINTPNTVLTDALNATIITYDGNEHSLQNDRGNYPLENCRLKPNYIPVGIKEYGDILYIVSYNPLNEHVEIGTYPSPLNVESSKDNDTNLELESVIGNINKSKKYSELVEDCKLHIWTSDNEEDSKLYPGDSYKIEEQNVSPYKYEALEYFVIDENRQKYNINDLIKKDGEWHPIAWQVPGWLAAQYRIGTFDDFIMSVRSAEAPTLGDNKPFDCKVDLNFQFRISDYLFLPQIISDQITNEEEIKSDLGIRLTFSDKASTKEISLKKGSFLDWYSDSKILWLNTSSEDRIILKNVEFGDTVTITATPFVRITVDGTTKEIVYDSFEETYSIYFNSIGSYSDFTIGDEIWKFYIDEDNDSNLYIEYNVSGPNVTNKAVQLYYRVLDLNGETIIKSWSEVSNYTGITSQGVGILDFEGAFEKEAIYILEFAFYEPNKNLNEVSNLETTKKLVIASKIFSNFVGEYSNFNDIDFDTWVNKYKDSITSDNWNVSHNPQYIDKNNIYQNYHWENGELVNTSGRTVFTNASLSKLWSNTSIDQDKGWFTSEETKTLNDNSIEFVAGYRGKEQLSISHNIKPLIGKLWENTPKVKLYINPYIQESYIQPKEWTREQIVAEKFLNEIVDVVYGKRKKFTYEINSEEFTHIKGLRSIKNIPLMWLYNWMDRSYANEMSHSRLRVGGVLNMDSMDPPSKPSLRETTINISRSDVTIPNNITRAILSALGENDFGILGVLMHEGEDIYRLIQGNTTLFSSEDKGQQILYTYLVFRQTDKNNNYAILVPFSNKIDEFWTKLLATSGEGTSDWWHSNAKAILNSMHDYIRDFTSNMQICTISNALSKGFLVKINGDGNSTDIPICSFEVKTDSFSKWDYKGFNLLNFEVRNSLSQKFGTDVCGKLLSGSITQIPEISFYSSIIEKSSNENLDNVFEEINKTVSTINSYIKQPEQVNGTLLSQIQSRSDTRGIYWLGNLEPSLIPILNRSYSNSSSDYLTVNSANIVQLYTDVGNDHNRLYIGWVENEALVDI